MRNYTAAEYRKASTGAGPFVLESNPYKNYRENRRVPILGGVIHITAGHSDWDLPDTSAEGTTSYGMTTSAQAAWHVCIDSDGIIPAIRDEWTAWHAGAKDIANTNDATLGMEIGTGSPNWRLKPTDWIDRTLRHAAVWWAPRVIKYGIPLRVERSRTALIDAIAARRKFGFCGHHLINPTNRVDPGLVQGVDTFPWEMFFTYLREEIALRQGVAIAPAPVQEDDMFEAADRTNLAAAKADAHDAHVHAKAANATAAKAAADAYASHVHSKAASAKADGLAVALKVLAETLPDDIAADFRKALTDAVIKVEVSMPEPTEPDTAA